MRSRRSLRWSPWSSAISMTDAIVARLVASPGLAVDDRFAMTGGRRRAAGRPDEEGLALNAAMAAAAAQLTALAEASQDEVAAAHPRVSAGPARGRGPDRAGPRGGERRAAGGSGMGRGAGPRDRRLPGDRRRHVSGTRGRSRRSAGSGVARAGAGRRIPAAIGRHAAIYADEELTPSRFLEIDSPPPCGAATKAAALPATSPCWRAPAARR